MGLDTHSRFEGLTEEEEARRQTFYQAHYTVPLRCLSIDEALRRSEQGLWEINDSDDMRKAFENISMLI